MIFRCLHFAKDRNSGVYKIMKILSKLAVISLFVTAAIWGLSYSAQASAMDTMSPLVFVFLRYLLGAAVLCPAIFYFRKKWDKSVIFGGICCGTCLAGGEILQQFGLLYTSAGKAGFLTALYVIMIPVIGVFIHRKSTWKIWCASLLSVGGTYLLCFNGYWESVGNFGDLLMLACALFLPFNLLLLPNLHRKQMLCSYPQSNLLPCLSFPAWRH